jgi:hypothetical protein
VRDFLDRWSFRLGLIMVAVGLAHSHGATAAIGAALVGSTIEDIISNRED